MVLCLLLVVGCLCKGPIHPAKLARWVIYVQSQLVLVIVEISVEDQHPKTISVQQLFCVISTYARKMTNVFLRVSSLMKGIISAITYKKLYFFGKVCIIRFKQVPDLLTFFKCFFGLWIQPVVPHFCCSVIDGVWGWRKLALGVVVMVTQSRVHLSTWKDRSSQISLIINRLINITRPQSLDFTLTWKHLSYDISKVANYVDHCLLS